MNLSRKDRWAVGGVIMSWALLPLLCYWLLPLRDLGVIGPVMLIGLLFAGAAIFGILWRAARRMEGESDGRMARLGFAKEPVEPDRVEALIPPELRGEPGRLDGFDWAGKPPGTRGVYLRQRQELRTSLYGLWVGSGRRSRYYVVTCLESRSWRWPGFHLSPADSREQPGQGLGMEEVRFPEDPEFMRRWVVLASEPGPIRGVFNPEARAAMMNLGECRVSASGSRLYLYAPRRLVLDEQAVAWLEQAGLLAAGFAAAAMERPALAVGK